MATERMYLNDSFRREDTAMVERVSRFEDVPSIVLSASIFYPESGGQLGDRGWIRWPDHQVEIIDTQIDGDGWVHHLVRQADVGLEPGLNVALEIDWDHRRDQMSQHTGQHLLSAAAFSLLHAETISARLGAEHATIDVEAEGLTPDQLDALQDEVNRIIMQALPIQTLYPTPAELEALPLRRASKVDDNVRLIAVDGVDLTPCGGTHCSNTGQVGPLVITRTQRVRQLTRIVFLAGRRAIDYWTARDGMLADTAATLDCAVHEVDAACARLRNQLALVQQDLGEARAAAVRAEVDRLAASHHDGTIVLGRPDLDQVHGRHLAQQLAQRIGGAVFIACGSNPQRFVLHVEAADGLDAAAWVRANGRTFGLRGGGKANHVEGVLTEGADLDGLMGSLKQG